MKSLIVGFTLYVIPCQTGNETDGFIYTNPSMNRLDGLQWLCVLVRLDRVVPVSAVGLLI